ncbi:MAG: nuclear transport factor 2 family protein [Gemmataceae bacterium]|nr:nuclear transport factor 2 family protein [Gemmataceae bacterium]
MPGTFAERFAAALQESEARKDPGPVAGLFGDDAELSNLAHAGPRRGADGARQFWQDYLDAFGTIRSEFSSIKQADGWAVLEWTSTGTLPAGKPVEYRGVSVLEVAGDKVSRFRTYYDTAALVTPPAAATT